MQVSHYVNQKRALSTRRDKGTVEGVPEYLHVISGEGTSTSVVPPVAIMCNQFQPEYQTANLSNVYPRNGT